MKVIVIADSVSEANKAIKLFDPAEQGRRDLNVVTIAFSEYAKERIMQEHFDGIVTFGYRALHLFSGWRTLNRNAGKMFFVVRGKNLPLLPLPSLQRMGDFDIDGSIKKFIGYLNSLEETK